MSEESLDSKSAEMRLIHEAQQGDRQDRIRSGQPHTTAGADTTAGRATEEA